VAGFFPIPDDLKQNFAWASDPVCQKLRAAFAGAELRFVGGVVRDSLRGVAPKVVEGEDFDLAVDLLPDETMQVLRDAHIRAIPTGFDHGTITAVIDGVLFEITSLRADVTTDGRHAEVAFGKDWTVDGHRRDFTINAIYLTMEGKLWDPTGGIDDIEADRVRFIGNPDERLMEDYLRILRFYRFSAHFAKEVDRDGRAACKRYAKTLSQIAAERIAVELKKLSTAKSAPMIIAMMAEDEVLREIYGQPANLLALEKLYEFIAPDFETFLVALWPDDLKALASRLRLSRKSFSAMVAIKKAMALKDRIDEKAAKEILYRFGQRAFHSALALRAVGDEALAKGLTGLLSLPDDWPVPDFPINGACLEKAGLKPGPAMGRALRRAEALWIEQDYPVDEAALQSIIAQVVI
jgi:poly(A) polymerase